MKNITIICVLVLLVSIASAKVDLVTLPANDITQLTIYNSADLTLVRDERSLMLKEGDNQLQFSWANTLIDPTSLSMLPKAHAADINIADLTFLPRVKNLGQWNIDSGISDKVPVEITYLTSGLSWRAFYMGTLSEDENTMRLQGYVVVSNNSGEDYENAQTRLIVGQVHLLDEIAQLARRNEAYGRPSQPVSDTLEGASNLVVWSRNDSLGVEKTSSFDGIAFDKFVWKDITKQGLSEYFLYTIEGTETIKNKWSKRLPSFDTQDVPVINLYKFEENRYGPQVMRYLSFTNDNEHELGDTPIPGGNMKVYRGVDAEHHLSYEGQSVFKYIPVGEEVELSLGAVSNVIIEPKLMDLKTSDYHFDTDGNIDGWDEVRNYKLTIKNTRRLPVKIEIKRNFNTNAWSIKNIEDANEYYEKVDVDTVKYTLTLDAESETSLEYILTTHQGTRIGFWTEEQKKLASESTL